MKEKNHHPLVLTRSSQDTRILFCQKVFHTEIESAETSNSRPFEIGTELPIQIANNSVVKLKELGLLSPEKTEGRFDNSFTQSEE